MSRSRIKPMGRQKEKLGCLWEVKPEKQADQCLCVCGQEGRGHLKSKGPVSQTEEFKYHPRASGGLTAFAMSRFNFQTHHSTSSLEMTWKELRLETERPLREPSDCLKRQGSECG